jgi:DNA-binding response OmpR family regulator
MNLLASDPPSVILVEDNERLRDELVHYLSEEGFTARGVGSGENLDRALEEHLADILVLDLNMAEEDGLSITRRIRRALPGLGLIILTGRVRGSERLEGYLCGADVYLTKPTRPEELAAVIRNLFARLTPPKYVDQWQLDMAELVLITPGGGQIPLTAGEARLLKLMALNGKHVEHATLAELLGDPLQSEAVNKARIEVAVSRLRRKLRQHAGARDCIKVQRNMGYQLGIAVTLLNLAAAQPSSPSASEA